MLRRIHLFALATTAVCAGPVTPAVAQDLPFTVTEIADFDIPWAMAFLPDGRLLVTEQRGALKLYTPGGSKVAIRGVPAGQLVRPRRVRRRRAASRLTPTTVSSI